MGEVKRGFDSKDLFWVEYNLRTLKDEVSEISSKLDLVFLTLKSLNLKLESLASVISSSASLKAGASFQEGLGKNLSPTEFGLEQTSAKSIPTEDPPFKASRVKNSILSTGNEGVPADRQTDQQTDRQMFFEKKPLSVPETEAILTSIDQLRLDLKMKFKLLTDQEFLVFSTIYQFNEEAFEGCDYKFLSEKLLLTESSIRDYVGKLIKKGAPLLKVKQNNKSVKVQILPSFRKAAPLSLILRLREI